MINSVDDATACLNYLSLSLSHTHTHTHTHISTPIRTHVNPNNENIVIYVQNFKIQSR